MDTLIHRAADLHSASGVARTLLQLMQNEDFSVAEVCGTIEMDPALTIRILATANSARFGMTKRVSSIQQAVTMLGRQSLRTVVLSFSVIERLTSGINGRIYADYWKRSLTTSLVADTLARSRQIDANDAYTSGLLADIGVLVLAQFEAEKYQPVFEENPHGANLVCAEHDAFGFDHAELGARLLEFWQFPQEMVMAVAAHHDADEADSQNLSSVVQAGNLMPAAIWIADSESFHAAFDCFRDQFDFNIGRFISLASEVNEQVAEEARTYGVEGVEGVDCEALQKEARALLSASVCEI